MKRRLTGALVAFALLFSLVAPRPASAATPLLDVITLDPTAASSSSQTGTAPFDATSYDPVGGTNPGTDGSPTDHVVRTNDLISYDFQYSVNNAPGNTVTLVSVLGQSGGVDVADWTSIPAGCGAGSSISGDGQTLTCVVGAVAEGSAQDVVATAKVRTSAPNGATIQPSVTISDPGSTGALPVTNTGYWLDQSHQSPTNVDTITSVAKFNLLKQTTAVQPSIESYTYNGEGSVQGYYLRYPILVREGDGSAGGRFGIASATLPITFTDTLSPGLNAVLPAANACGANGSNGITIPTEPYGAIGIVGSATSANSVINSGTIACTQAAAGGPITVTISGATNTSGSTFPVNTAGGPGVDNLTYVVAGYLRVFVPDTTGNIAAVGNTAAFGDTYSPINPNQPNANEPLSNRTASVNLLARGPAGASGSSGKAFYTNTAENGFATSNGNGPALTSPQEIVGVFQVTNGSNASTGNTTIQNLTACDTIDTAHATVTAFDGTTGAVDLLWGGAVHLSQVHGGTFGDTSPPPGFAVAYGTPGTGADCSVGTGAFYPTLAAYQTANPGVPVARMKFTTTSLTPGQQLRVQISLTVNTGLAAGTIVRNDLRANGTSSAGGPALTTSASTTGQIFTTNLNVTKYLYRDTSGHALFAASQATAPSAAGASGGQVDTNQQFVAFLDNDGRQGTLPSNATVTCDIIPANAQVHAFDGTTGPANATYGGAVTFATISGTTPASYTVEYSTAPHVVNDTCLNPADGWSTTPPAPIGATTKIRATFTLPANAFVRMYVNLIANAGLAPGTTISNSMVTTVGGANALTSAQGVTVEPETVSMTKTGPSSAVTAGQPAAFTLQGYIQGVGAATSGLVTITDTLPIGLTYVPNSAVLTPPPSPTTWIAGSGSATPTSITTNGAGQQVIVWTLGQTTAAPGVYIQLPTIVFQANTDISISNGTSLINSGAIADPNDGNPGGAGHTATASVIISNAGAFHISKTTTTTQIPTGGTIAWSLNYANTGATAATSTDFIDELPYSGDGRGSSFHGTLTLVQPTAANAPAGMTYEYTKAAHGNIDDDAGCTSNGGSVAPPTGGCHVTGTTTWCPALSGGACPATMADVTAIRMIGGALPANSGTLTIHLTATTSGNLFTDAYFNQFGARTNILTLGVHSPAVETIVPVPANPFVTLVKSCLAPPTCTTAAQAPGTDITYGITATNTGGHVAGALTITDPLPVSNGTKYMDFKLGTATASFPSGTTMTVSYSADGVNYNYVPVSGGGGAATGYDRNVVAVRWTLTSGTLGTAAPGNTGTVQFTAAIQ